MKEFKYRIKNEGETQDRNIGFGFDVFQSTQHFDKNEIEIYEGDVVEFRLVGNPKDRFCQGEVRFYPEFGCFGLHVEGAYNCDKGEPFGSSGSSTSYKPYNWKSYNSLEVIGNIYESEEFYV